jgi:RimJ/RimL family protein N-acetyltransferase
MRRLRAGDADALRALFDRLSPEARYQRFLGFVGALSDDAWSALADADGHEHVALGVFASDGLLIAVGRFIRSPHARNSAEVAFTVADDWQRRGVGAWLADALVARARELGVETFVAHALPTNPGIERLLSKIGQVATIDPMRRDAEFTFMVDGLHRVTPGARDVA